MEGPGDGADLPEHECRGGDSGDTALIPSVSFPSNSLRSLPLGMENQVLTAPQPSLFPGGTTARANGLHRLVQPLRPEHVEIFGHAKET